MDNIEETCCPTPTKAETPKAGFTDQLNRRLNLLMRTGQILVDSSADTSRIMRNMHRAAAFLGFPKENINIYVDYYMVTVSLCDSEHSFVQMRRCRKHGIDMAAIQDVSKLTWRALKRDYSLDDYECALDWITNRNAHTATGRWLSAPALPAVASAYSSDATGRRSSMRR